MKILILFKRCDADPAALSKYVLALIKKDKPLDDLKESMSQQMNVVVRDLEKLILIFLIEHISLVIVLLF